MPKLPSSTKVVEVGSPTPVTLGNVTVILPVVGLIFFPSARLNLMSPNSTWAIALRQKKNAIKARVEIFLIKLKL